MNHLFELLVADSHVLCHGKVRFRSILAVQGQHDGDVQQFFGLRVKRAGRVGGLEKDLPARLGESGYG